MMSFAHNVCALAHTRKAFGTCDLENGIALAKYTRALFAILYNILQMLVNRFCEIKITKKAIFLTRFVAFHKKARERLGILRLDKMKMTKRTVRHCFAKRRPPSRVCCGRMTCSACFNGSRMQEGQGCVGVALGRRACARFVGNRSASPCLFDLQKRKMAPCKGAK